METSWKNRQRAPLGGDWKLEMVRFLKQPPSGKGNGPIDPPYGGKSDAYFQGAESDAYRTLSDHSDDWDQAGFGDAGNSTPDAPYRTLKKLTSNRTPWPVAGLAGAG